MAVRMAGLALGGRAEDGGDVVVALDVGLLREIKVAAVRLAPARGGFLYAVFGLASLPCPWIPSLIDGFPAGAGPARPTRLNQHVDSLCHRPSPMSKSLN